MDLQFASKRRNFVTGWAIVSFSRTLFHGVGWLLTLSFALESGFIGLRSHRLGRKYKIAAVFIYMGNYLVRFD
jgi:hypothetical protein